MSIVPKVLPILLSLLFASLAQAATYTSIDVPGAVATQAFGINNAGDIVGSYTDANTQTHGFLLRDGVFTTIDMPGFTQTVARGINDSGVICGYASSANLTVGFIFDGQTFTTLQFPGVQETEANGINNNGKVVGWYGREEGIFPRWRGFIWVSGSFTTIMVQRDITILTGINNLGYIVGFDTVFFGSFVISPNGSLLSSYSTEEAEGINDGKLVVSYLTNQTFGTAHPVSYTKFQQVRFPGASDTFPFGINNAGEIVGYYTDQRVVEHGFLRTM